LLHLREYTLYSVVEPCLMCCGAIHWAKIGRVVYGLSQSSLQTLTNGRGKRSIRDLLPAGRHAVEIIAGLATYSDHVVLGPERLGGAGLGYLGSFPRLTVSRSDLHAVGPSGQRRTKDGGAVTPGLSHHLSRWPRGPRSPLR
jgi:hypothetical protein